MIDGRPPPEKRRPHPDEECGPQDSVTRRRDSNVIALAAAYRPSTHQLRDRDRALERRRAQREVRRPVDRIRPSAVRTPSSELHLEDRGVRILRRRKETVPGAFRAVHCCRYWTAAEALDRGLELLVDRHRAPTV